MERNKKYDIILNNAELPTSKRAPTIKVVPMLAGMSSGRISEPTTEDNFQSNITPTTHMKILDMVSYISKPLESLIREGILTIDNIDNQIFYKLFDYEAISSYSAEVFIKSVLDTLYQTRRYDTPNTVYYYEGGVQYRAPSANDAMGTLSNIMRGLKSYHTLGLTSKYFYNVFKHTLDFKVYGSNMNVDDCKRFDKAVGELVVREDEVFNDYVGYASNDALSLSDASYLCIAKELYYCQIGDPV